MSLQSLPKIELHLHLDCSLSRRLAGRLDPSVSRDAFDRNFIAPPKCRDLADYLTRARSGVQLLQSREALSLAVEDLFAQLQDDGVIYAEIRFAPLLHLERGLAPEAVVETVDRATEAASRATGIEARLILCTLRHFSELQSLETVHLGKAFQGSRVAALDLAADEAGFPLDAHCRPFAFAAAHGLERTAHAGEACGPASVRETLALLAPSRLGHGVRSIEDPALVERLARERIHLEVCPTSNVQTGVCESYSDHPVDRLFRAGVSLGINTDARTISDVTLSEEYANLQTAFGWGPAHFRRCNLDALEAAFLPPTAKGPIRARLLAAYGDFE
jgi:adenosine deaminase